MSRHGVAVNAPGTAVSPRGIAVNAPGSAVNSLGTAPSPRGTDIVFNFPLSVISFIQYLSAFQLKTPDSRPRRNSLTKVRCHAALSAIFLGNHLFFRLKTRGSRPQTSDLSFLTCHYLPVSYGLFAVSPGVFRYLSKKAIWRLKKSIAISASSEPSPCSPPLYLT